MIRKPKRSNPRDNTAYREMCRKIWKRDKGRCQMPDCKSRGNEVHHIRRYASNARGRYSTFNCILLCKDHHTQVTGKEDTYAPLLLRIAAQNEVKQNESH